MRGTRFAAMRQRGSVSVILLAVGLLLIAGCKDEPTAKGASDATAGSGPASIQIVDLQGLKDAVAEHRGNVVYIDFWATWCGPCVKGLPELSELQKAYGSRGLKIITVSFDEPNIAQTKVKATLAKAGWSGQSLLVKDRAAQNEIVAWLGQRWRSELPARYLFDREGNQVREILAINESELPPLKQMVEETLGNPG